MNIDTIGTIIVFILILIFCIIGAIGTWGE